MSYTSLRIHPAIGIARVGNSEEYYLGPETMAGMDIGKEVTGGLPIKPGTEDTTIMSTDLRDAEGRLKRQAARFRIYQYSFENPDGVESYPTGKGDEVKIGSTVDGKKVKEIIWTVHLANKKANSWQGGSGIDSFQNGNLPSLRNPGFGSDTNDENRLKKLVIDAGPRALAASTGKTVNFDMTTAPSCGDQSAGAISPLPEYPASFPGGDGHIQKPPVYSRAIKSLGAMTSEKSGRLIVLGGYGHACSFDDEGNYSTNAKLDSDVNNNYWLDDTSDGPVTAFLLFEDGSTHAVEGSAWVIAADPAYAPQTANVVSLWDDLYNTWVKQFQLQPEIFCHGEYQSNYKTQFNNDVLPILKAASLQKWNTSLPKIAIDRHDALGKITADWSEYPLMNYIRDPNDNESEQIGTPLMPLSLGDAKKSFLSLTTTQYHLMKQWSEGCYIADAAQPLGQGEALDKTVLFNCLGGRFSPGIEMSFTVRDPILYKQNWSKHSDGGPFRINMQALDYSKANHDKAFLGEGYIPLRQASVQPGDLSKFMALPWHTDYNSCATHLPSPNPGGDLTDENIDAATDLNPDKINTFLYSSWPAQRPVAVYTYQDVVANEGELKTQRFSVRGNGTEAVKNTDAGFNRPAMNVGRYQDRKEFLLNWDRIGIVMQSPAIVPDPNAPKTEIPEDFYLEVASKFECDQSNLVEYWRNTAIDKLYSPSEKK
ncbi:MAG: LodA/GoxA family CTQ-dependent oxidase [Methylobacter sp.]|nr:LodA/GoxA family CTQ-dependent oxidase [Methylobacter sp.]